MERNPPPVPRVAIVRAGDGAELLPNRVAIVRAGDGAELLPNRVAVVRASDGAERLRTAEDKGVS